MLGTLRSSCSKQGVLNSYENFYCNENVTWIEWYDSLAGGNRLDKRRLDYYFIDFYHTYFIDYKFCYRRPDLLRFRKEHRLQKKHAALTFEEKFFSSVWEHIDWTDDLRNSHQFNVFLDKVVKMLEESLGIDDLYKSLRQNYVNKYYDRFRGMTYHLLGKRNLAGSWLFALDNKPDQDYIPDVEDIVKTYIYYKLCSYWRERLDNDKIDSISKLDITRCYDNIFSPRNICFINSYNLFNRFDIARDIIDQESIR